MHERATELEYGSRADDGDGSPLHSELRSALHEHADRQVASVVQSFQQGQGNQDRFAAGLGTTVAALRRGQVETLLWQREALDQDTRLWIGPDPSHIALTEQELRDMDVAEPCEESAEAALLRAAVMTSAQVVFVSADALDLGDGVGALLRFEDPTMGD